MRSIALFVTAHFACRTALTRFCGVCLEHDRFRGSAFAVSQRVSADPPHRLLDPAPLHLTPPAELDHEALNGLLRFSDQHDRRVVSGNCEGGEAVKASGRRKRLGLGIHELPIREGEVHRHGGSRGEIVRHGQSVTRKRGTVSG